VAFLLGVHSSLTQCLDGAALDTAAGAATAAACMQLISDLSEILTSSNPHTSAVQGKFAQLVGATACKLFKQLHEEDSDVAGTHSSSLQVRLIGTGRS